MFLLGKDYLSIWDIAHKWAGFAPDTSDQKALPEQVSYLIHKLIEGYLSKELKLRRANGLRVPEDSLFLLLWNINIWQKQMWDCLNNGKFNKAKLSNLFVKRSELLKLCFMVD